jgi:hypothetical protein
MKIETYEIEPASSQIATLAEDGEHKELCEKLGLKGQLSLSNNESGTVFPYRRMTMVEQRVFEIHCPNKTKLSAYKSDAIPVRVLQVAAHAIDCGVTRHLSVWHPEEARLDPVLVGCTSEYSGELYLLARWGEVWKDFAQLLAEAKAIWTMRRTALLEKARRSIEGHAASVAPDADLYFSGKQVEGVIYFNAGSEL